MTVGEYGIRSVNGQKLAGRLNLLLSLAGRDLDESLLSRVVQGSYNAGGVSASAGTHDRGGAVDLSVRGWSYDRITEVLTTLRRRGLIAWYRHEGQGFTPHIHGIDRGANDLSTGAAEQVRRFDLGENGLALRQRDDGPRVAVPSFDYEAGLREWEVALLPKDIIFGTWNTPHRLDPRRMAGDIAAATREHGVSLWALQETTDTDWRILKPDGWDWWRPARAQSSTLVFDPAVWEPVLRPNGRRRQGSFRVHASGDRPRYVVFAVLRHRPTGKVFKIGGVHLPAFKTRSPRQAMFFRHAEKRAAKWLGRGGPDRVLLGDFNANWGLWTRNLNKVSVWEKPRNNKTGPRNTSIDHVLRKKGRRRPQVVATVSGRSDHDALIVRL